MAILESAPRESFILSPGGIWAARFRRTRLSPRVRRVRVVRVARRTNFRILPEVRLSPSLVEVVSVLTSIMRTVNQTEVAAVIALGRRWALLQPLGTIVPPGVRVRLRISFSSAQRLTRASESTPGPQETAGGWDTAVRVGLSSRCAP